MLRNLSIVAVVLIVGILFLAFTSPPTFSVTQSVSIRAPAKSVFPLINDLRSFSTWSPYEREGPCDEAGVHGARTGSGCDV